MKKNTLKALVESVLLAVPDSRNDDAVRAMHTWHKLRPELFIQVEGREGLYLRAKDFLELPSHDHISRIRRKFQEAGKYPPTVPEVVVQRRKAVDTWIDFARRGTFSE